MDSTGFVEGMVCKLKLLNEDLEAIFEHEQATLPLRLLVTVFYVKYFPIVSPCHHQISGLFPLKTALEAL